MEIIWKDSFLYISIHVISTMKAESIPLIINSNLYIYPYILFLFYFNILPHTMNYKQNKNDNK